MQADSSGSTCSRCICCLSEGKHEDGEVFFEMFTKCLNLIMVPDSNLSFPMCLICINFINEVQRFRDMVLATQKQLNVAIVGDNDTNFIDVPTEEIHKKDTVVPTEKITQNAGFAQETKIKVELCDDTLDSTYEWPENIAANISDDQFDVKNENVDSDSREKINSGDFDVKFESIITNKSKRKRSIKNGKSPAKRKRKKSDSESDTPISQIKNKKLQQEEKKEAKATLSTSELMKLRSIKTENKKIRSNIILLLKHSTIIPFLNNFKSAFKCFYCDKGYITFKELKEHTQKEHIKICETTVRKVLRKLPEYMITADISSLKCRLCEEEFKTIENVTEHLIKIHEKTYNDTDKKPSHGIISFDLSQDVLKCHLCDKKFMFFKSLLVHMNEHGSFVCYICGKKFYSERKCLSHVNKHETSRSRPTCKQCGKNFVSKSALSYHNRKEHKKSTIKCLKCPQTFHFERYAQRLDHMEKVHGIKKPIFKCETCGKECKTSGILASHIRLTHKRSKEYRCDICSYATFNNSHFHNHMNTHSGVKNHECELCKKRFLKMYSLTRHLMMHRNDKRFLCPLCDASFIQKVNMKSHMRHRHKDSGIDLSKL